MPLSRGQAASMLSFQQSPAVQPVGTSEPVTKWKVLDFRLSFAKRFEKEEVAPDL